MRILKDTSIIAIGATTIGAGLLLAAVGAEIPLLATYAAIMTLLLTFVAITLNTYSHATPDRTRCRLLHDPETSDAARSIPAAAARRGAR